MSNNNNPEVPRMAVYILGLFLKHELFEEVLGDLEENYQKQLATRSKFRAKLNYWYQVIQYIRPFAIRKYRSNSIFYIMVKHNVILTFRNFSRNKSSFFINLLGLTTGMGTVILIFLWVNDELSKDKFHAKDNQIYQVFLNHEESGSLRTGPDVPGQLADALESEVPEIKMAVEDTNPNWFENNFTLSIGEENINGAGKFSGSEYFQVFDFPLKHGKPDQVLSESKGIVLSESMALKLFKSLDVIGKTLKWNLLHLNGEATVTGIFEDLGPNTSEHFDFILPYTIFRKSLEDRVHWGNYICYSHVLLNPGTDVKVLNEKLDPFIKEKVEWSNVHVFLSKYSDQYLYGNYENGVQAGGRILYVQLFIIIGLFILVIASINFMNLTTAKASQRMKEIGIKKTMGAGRGSLIIQFMMEAIIISLFALLISCVFVYWILPKFNQFTDKQLLFNISSELFIYLIAITFTTGILAGSYPALYLSGFNPQRILQGKLKTTFGEAWVRKGLVVFQFTLSIIMIASVIVVYKQLEFIYNKNLGYNRENVLIVPVEGKVVKNYPTYLEQLKNIPGVVNASVTSHPFVHSQASTTGVSWEGKPPEVEVLFEQARVYYDLIETLDFELTEGRTFSKEFSNEKSNIIFNETAIEVMGIEDPIGKKVTLWGDEKEIIGVVKDFNYASLHEQVKPMLFHINTDFLPISMIRIEPGNIGETIDNLEAYYQNYNPGYTFDYEFMDKNYQNQYQTETRISILSQFFAVIAIIISCLGLYGLAAYTAQRRKKEIGIRKVLGIGEVRVVYLLTGDFTKMVVLAICLAIPISYYLIRLWLAQFAYHVNLSWAFFGFAALASLIIAWLTVSIETYKVSSVNPVECLKDD